MVNIHPGPLLTQILRNLVISAKMRRNINPINRSRAARTLNLVLLDGFLKFGLERDFSQYHPCGGGADPLIIT